MKFYRLADKDIKSIVSLFLFPKNKIKHFRFASEFLLCNNLLRKWSKDEIYFMR